MSLLRRCTESGLKFIELAQFSAELQLRGVMQRPTNWSKWAKYGLVTAAVMLLAVFLIKGHLYKPMPIDPYHCYIVHQRKDGSCPPNYRSEKEVLSPFSGAGSITPRFTEPDGF